MRRKSGRNKSKSSPESKPEKPKRGRPSRKKKSPSSSPDRDSTSEECVPGKVEVVVQDVTQSTAASQSEIVTTPEKVRSHSDEDNLEVWHVKAPETSSDTGEIQKLKICLSRPSMTPERPDRSPRGRKKLNRSSSQLECPSEATEEKRKGRHRSRRSSAKDAESTDVANSDDNVENTLTSDSDAKIEKSSDIPVKPLSDIDSVKDVHVSESTQETGEISSVAKDEDASSSGKAVTIDNSEDEKIKALDKNVLQVSIVTSVNTSESEPVVEKSGDDDKSVETTSNVVENTTEENETDNTQKETIIPLKITPEAGDDHLNTTTIDSQIVIKETPPKEKPSDDVCPNVDKILTADKIDDKSIEDVLPPVKSGESKPGIVHQPEQDSVNEVQRKNIIISEGSDKKDVEMKKNDKDVKCEEKCAVEPSKEDPDINKASEIKNCESVITDTPSKTSTNIKSISNDNDPPREIVTESSKCDDNSKVDVVSDKNSSEHLPSVQDAQVAQSVGNMRKRRWGSRSSKVSKSSIVNISTDSLKNLISNVEPVSAEEVLLEVIVKEPIETEPPKKVLTECQNKTNGKYSVQDKVVDKEFLGSMSHRKISIVNEEAPKLHRSPSPPKYKSSSVLYITNLVRPFTLAQLKNLLLRTGRIVENGFWIDKIKSKCYVQYETEDEATETRHALHGVTWPVSNPKVLNVDFGSKSAMLEALASGEEEKPVGHVDTWVKEQHTRDSKSGVMDIDQKSSDKRTVVREWDLGKGDLKEDKAIERQANRHRDVIDIERRKRRTKSRSPSPARKFKKKEEEAPSKLLDDLFKKTKTTPCIYWLPLNAETILVKEEQRRKHMAEHERRLEELRRAAEEQKGGRHNVAPHHASTHRHR